MDGTAGLRAIGFWNGPHTPMGWPELDWFVDAAWDRDDREFVADYLRRGVLARTYMGYSTCRLCGRQDNGDSEYSDGVYVWPSGLVHYVVEHDVRLPQEFVDHAIALTEHLEGERDESWWAGSETGLVIPQGTSGGSYHTQIVEGGHGYSRCVSRAVYDHAGASEARLMASVLGAFFIVHLFAALGSLLERRRFQTQLA